MKKTFIAIVLFFVLMPGFAQNSNGWQYEFGVGIYSLYDRSSSGTRTVNGIKYDRRHSEIIDSSTEKSYNGISYTTNPTVLPPVFFAGGYVSADLPLGFFLDVYANYAWNTLNGGPATMNERELILHVMPEVRFYYDKTDKRAIYASVAAGVRARHYAEVLGGDKISCNDFGFSWQVSPLGMSFGKHWYFSWDLGWGRAFSALKANCGYKF